MRSAFVLGRKVTVFCQREEELRLRGVEIEIRLGVRKVTALKTQSEAWAASRRTQGPSL